MLVVREWSVFFKLLTFIGVLPISISKNNRIVSTKSNKIACWISFCSQNLAQTVALYFTASNLFDYLSVEKTYKDMQVLQDCSSCIIHFVVHTWIFTQKPELLKILLLVITKRANSEIVLRNLRTFRNFNVFYHVGGVIIDLLVSFLMSKFAFESITILISNSINFLLSSLILMLFTTIVELIEDVLRKSNQRLEVIVFHVERCHCSKDYYFELMDILKTRNDLLSLCSFNISRCFGVPLIFISIFLLICVSHVPIFLIWSLRNTFSWITFVVASGISIYMVVPKIVVFKMVFSFNLRIQVSLLLIY